MTSSIDDDMGEVSGVGSGSMSFDLGAFAYPEVNESNVQAPAAKTGLKGAGSKRGWAELDSIEQPEAEEQLPAAKQAKNTPSHYKSDQLDHETELLFQQINSLEKLEQTLDYEKQDWGKVAEIVGRIGLLLMNRSRQIANRFSHDTKDELRILVNDVKGTFEGRAAVVISIVGIGISVLAAFMGGQVAFSGATGDALTRSVRFAETITGVSQAVPTLGNIFDKYEQGDRTLKQSLLDLMKESRELAKGTAQNCDQSMSRFVEHLLAVIREWHAAKKAAAGGQGG